MNTLHILTQQVRTFSHDAVAMLPKLALAVLIAAVFFSIGGRLSGLIARRIRCRKGRPEANVLILVEKSLRLLLVGLGIFLALSIVVPSLKFHDLIALLGIGGVAVGFAFRDVLQNFFAGVVLLLTRAFEVGDRIESGAVEGVVEEISIRSTIVKNDSGDRIIIPNGLLMTREITHLLRAEKGKVAVSFYVPAEASLARVLDATKGVLQGMTGGIESGEAKIDFQSMTEKSLLLKASWRTPENPPGPLGTKEVFVARLQQALDAIDVTLGLRDVPGVPTVAGFERAPDSQEMAPEARA
jgi:small-conductance mechanosensitive channel